ncbi:MAG: hypothetical protein ISR59_11265 [Anaerolineales bacterium]|uniref:Uncharacterized protein n=1 Tax=Candidatus Desulfolinea nitratireducens TaxID=2841698 RepID=A0A8J6NFZ9_9CHLR|nr:hypothetical protein [Candidatus Desulfolinea nitratireducens]MBL6961680.1 hypothetical protein [Anaerolineales bacterium]
MNFEEKIDQEIEVEKENPGQSEIWDLFENSKTDEKLLIFSKMQESDVLDAEYAFEFLTTLKSDFDLTTKEGRANYALLLNKLQDEKLDIYEHDSHYYNQDLITFAILDERWDNIPGLLSPFTSGKHLDEFDTVISQLKYHGCTKIILEAMETAYPGIQASSEYIYGADEEFAGELSEIMLIDYLESSDHPRPDDPTFLDKAGSLVEWKKGWLDWFIPRITQTKSTEWTLDDFLEDINSEEWREKFRNLLLEFVATEWEKGIPLSRCILGWHQLFEIFYTQFEKLGKNKKSDQKSKKSFLARCIIPNAKKMDETLGGHFSIMGGKPYEISAGLELLPIFLGFMEALGIIQHTQKQNALGEIRKRIITNIPNVLSNYGGDPILLENLEKAWLKK